MQPAIFLDRDGVIVENRANYIRSYAQVEFYPQAIEALRSIRDLPYKIVIVTNQSGIGRGVIPKETVHRINQQIVDHLQSAGIRVDGAYLCPHAPSEECNCRKPLPGMLLQAASELDIDLERSYMIGDALTDVQAGFNAGIPNVALVLTGRGSDQANLPTAKTMPHFPIYDDLSEVIRDIRLASGLR